MTSKYKSFDSYLKDNFAKYDFISLSYDKYFDYTIDVYSKKLVKLGKEHFLDNINTYFSKNAAFEILEYIYLHDIQIFKDNDIQINKIDIIENFYKKIKEDNIILDKFYIIINGSDNLKTGAKLQYLNNLDNN